MTELTATTPALKARGGRRAFALHVGEMFLAMLAGMVVLGGRSSSRSRPAG